MTNGKIADMVLNQGGYDNSDDMDDATKKSVYRWHGGNIW